MAMCRRSRAEFGTRQRGVESAGGEWRQVFYGTGWTRQVQLDFANILRLGSNAQVNLATFTKKYIQCRLAGLLTTHFGESETERRSIRRTLLCIQRTRMRVSLKCDRMATASSLCAGRGAACTPQGICQH